MLGNDFELSRRHLDLRQGRAVGARRRRHADDEDRRDHGRAGPRPMSATGERGRRMPDPKACQRLAEQMLALALKAGADGAEVLVRDGTELEVKVRLGEPELVQEAGSRALGLRVLKDERAARDLHVGSRRPRRSSGSRARASSWRRWPSPIRVAALPAREEMARDVPELDLWDDARAVASTSPRAIRRARARRGGGARRSTSASPTPTARSSGATVGATAFATSAGFSGGYRGTLRVARRSSRCATTPTARSATASTGPRRASRPGSRTPRRSGSRPRGARSPSWARARSRPARCRSIFSADAARGAARPARGRDVGRRDLARVELPGRPRRARRSRRRWSTIVDDPLLRARPGLAAVRRRRAGDAARTCWSSEGVLRTYLCDVYAARKLGRRSTGSAARGIGGSPHVTTSNFILRAGRTPAADLREDRSRPLRHRPDGLRLQRRDRRLTRRARAASGSRRGERAYPVTEITVSANFDELWKGIDAVGDDLDTRSSVQCPIVPRGAA